MSQSDEPFYEALEVFAPPPDLTVSQWADSERRLSPESSSEPGQWSTDRAPYQREIMDSVKDPELDEICLMTSAQVGKTEMINNVVGYL
jgi:phage terminase large subunit GpA-like protein